MTPGQPPPGETDTRNLILAVVLVFVIFVGWEFFYASPERARLRAQQAAQVEEQVRAGAAQPQASAPAASETAGIDIDAGEVPFENATGVDGAINLAGARFDDLFLKQHFETVARNSEVRLLRPEGTDHHLDVVLGWEGVDETTRGVGARAVWTAPEGARLTPDSPVTLTHESDDGLRVTRTIALDENYVFTITDRVENTGETARALRPYGVVRRTGLPDDYINNQIVYQGMLGVFGPELNLKQNGKYQRATTHAERKQSGDIGQDQRLYSAQGTGGWIGMSDHYWLTALLPDQAETIEGRYDASRESGETVFRAAYVGETRTIAPGASVDYAQRVFAGPKTVELLREYEAALGLPLFDRAVDWGFMWPLTPALMWLLTLFGGWFGNFGLAIMATTIVVKLALFPLVNRSFEAMSKLKKLQPKMKEVQERYAADKQRQQQEMIKLYQTEKINPVAGCLPILIQIPIFYALYKVLTVTIEMRHAPFFGWINDLSAPDPTTVFNLFGLLPFDPTAMPLIGAFLAIGVWPILYGITMWGVTALNPPAPDPIQRQVFQLLPILFVFLFANFAAGLVIYWTWSNVLSILQQYVIMRKNGVETEFDKLLARLTSRGSAAPS